MTYIERRQRELWHAREEEELRGRVYLRRVDGELVACETGEVMETSPPRALIWSTREQFASMTRETDGLPGYPEPHQEQFLNRKTRYNALLGGVGSGKTVAACLRFIELVLLNPQRRSILGVPVAKISEMNTLEKLEKFIPLWMVILPTRHSTAGRLGQWKKGFYLIKWFNGHISYVLSLDARTRSYRGTQGIDCSHVWIDEASAVVQEGWTALIERVRVGREQQIIVTSSYDQPCWLEAFFAERTEMISYEEVSTEAVGFRSSEYIEGLKAAMSRRLYDRKVGGQRVVLQGLVYAGLLDQASEAGGWLECQYDPRVPVTIGVDLGYRRAHIVVLQRTTQHGIQGDVIIEESALAEVTVEQIAGLIESWVSSYKYIVEVIYTDYSSTSAADREHLRRILPQHRVQAAVVGTHARYWYITSGVHLVQGRCCDARGSRRLWVARHLWGRSGGPGKASLWEALGRYHWREWQIGRPIDETPVKDGYEHALDALRYAILGMYTPKPGATFGR